MTEANVAVLIDYENVGLDSIQYLLDQLSDMGRIIVKRAYADWSVERNKRDQLLELGIEAVHHFRSTTSGKNSSDIRLAIDAVDLLHNANLDTFVIVSADSDFVPLVSRMRAAGKIVVGAGRRKAASATLIKSCDRYIYLEDSKAAPGRAPKPQGRSTPQAPSLVVRAVEASMDDRGQVVGSKLYQTMQRIDPSFSYKSQGHGTFARYLASRSEVSVTHPPDTSDVIVRLASAGERDAVATESHPIPPNWDKELDAAWTRRQLKRLSSRAAASDAAKVLGVPRLTASRFPSLDRLLDASPGLRANWRREGSTIIRRD